MALSASLIITARRNPIPTDRQIKRGLSRALLEGTRRLEKSFREHGKHYTGELNSDTKIGRDFAEVTSGDERFAYVALGTRPHTITARAGGSLAFSENYAVKTQPLTIPSQAGGSRGNTVLRQSVEHPGIDPRNTQVAMAEDVKPIFINAVKGAIGAR